jgi:hypothetical protein
MRNWESRSNACPRVCTVSATTIGQLSFVGRWEISDSAQFHSTPPQQMTGIVGGVSEQRLPILFPPRAQFRPPRQGPGPTRSRSHRDLPPLLNAVTVKIDTCASDFPGPIRSTDAARPGPQALRSGPSDLWKTGFDGAFRDLSLSGSHPEPTRVNSSNPVLEVVGCHSWAFVDRSSSISPRAG